MAWPRLGLSAFGAIEGGVHPRAGGGISVAGALLWTHLRLEGLPQKLPGAAPRLLRKPFRSGELVAAVREALASRAGPGPANPS